MILPSSTLGPKIPVADELNIVNPSGKTLTKGLDITIHQITPQPKIHIKLLEIKKATNKGCIMQLIMQQLLES